MAPTVGVGAEERVRCVCAREVRCAVHREVRERRGADAVSDITAARICLALARAPLSMHGPARPPARVTMPRSAERRWCARPIREGAFSGEPLGRVPIGHTETPQRGGKASVPRMSEDVDVPGGYAAMHQRRSEASGDRGRHVRWATVRPGGGSGRDDDESNNVERDDAADDERRGAARAGPSGRRTRADSPERTPRRGVPPAPSPARRRAASAPRSTHRGASNAERHESRRVAPPAPSSRDAAVRAALARPVRLSAVLRDHPTCFDPNKLRIGVVDKRVSVVDEVPPAYKPTQRLYMSHNNVKQLAGLAQFRELRLLSAGDNPVDDIPQLDALARGCPHLEALSLELCPVAKLPFYRAHVVARLPRLKSLDGVVVSAHESAQAPRLVRKDVGHLEMLMNAAVTADKLRRAYRLAKVHEELARVVYAPNGPVEPCSLPGPNEGSAPLDPRLFLRLCAPERTMTSGELATLARRLRGAVAAEAPTARRTLRDESSGKRASSSAGGSVDESAVWEASYAAVVRTEQRDTAALLAFLDDARAAKLEATRSGEADPFGAALRCGYEAARAREAEMRSDREAAVAVLVDETAERDRRVVGEALRRETRFGGATKFRATTSEEDGDDEARAPAGRNYRHDDDGDRDDEDVVRPPTPRSRAPREPAARTRDTRPDDDDDDDDLGNEDEEEDRYSRRVHDWARGFDVRLDRAGNASAVRLGGSSDPPTRSRVPWGHGPGTAGEEARARRAASARVGAAATLTRAPPRRSRSASPARGSSGARSREEDRAEDARVRRDVGRRRPSGKVYEMLSREVDALRDALESQLGSETEILSINDELRRRCEGAEQATERAERECERAARTHSDAMARVVNELREARELAESLAEALERDRADRANETKAKEEERARSEEVLRRKAGQMSERAAELDRELVATRSELDDVRASLTTHLLSEERRVGADALRSRYAAKRCLRRWLSHAAVAKHGRVLRLACFRRAGAFALLTWSLRVRTQRRARLMLARWRERGAVAAIRAWRLAALVVAVGACLRRRRALRRWFANAGVHKATRLREEEEAGRAELERLEEEARVEAERAEHKKNLGDYADAVLAASSPALRNARKLATLHKSLSTWRIALIRSQRARLDDLAGTCDNLARAAENAASAAAGVEHRNAELGDAAEALRERIIVAEQRAEEFERAASVESAERKAMEEELERQRDRASRAEERAAGAGAAAAMETRSAEAAAAAATGEAASWRAAAEVGERAIVAAAEALQEWAEEIEREAARASRSPRKGGLVGSGTPGPGARGTPPRMSPKKLALLASPLGSSLKSPHSASPSNPVAFLRRVDGSPGLAPEEEARLHSRLEHLPVRARGLHENLRGAIREARALREEAAAKSRGDTGEKPSLTPVREAQGDEEK